MGTLMRSITAATLACLVSVLSACNSTDRAFDEKEEAAVYRAYIDTDYASRNFLDSQFVNRPFNVIVISDRTSGFVVPFSYQKSIAKLSPKPDKETVENFLDRNDGKYPESKLTERTLRVIGRYPLNPHIKFGLPHALISDGEIDQIFSNGKWGEFFRRYPNSRGLVWLSRVGFNKSKTQALLYFAHQYTEAAGEGFLILLAKTASGWKKTAEVLVWIS
jgi:hypothetical protein